MLGQAIIATGLIGEALGFGPLENCLPQVDPVIEDGPDGGGALGGRQWYSPEMERV